MVIRFSRLYKYTIISNWGRLIFSSRRLMADMLINILKDYSFTGAVKGKSQLYHSPTSYPSPNIETLLKT